MSSGAANFAACPEFVEDFPWAKSADQAGRLAEVLLLLYRLPVAAPLPIRNWPSLGIAPNPATIANPADSWGGKLPPELAKRLLSFRRYRKSPEGLAPAARESVDKLKQLAEPPTKPVEASPRPLVPNAKKKLGKS